MIPVSPEPEPAVFDEKVRQPGKEYLRTRPDEKTDFQPYWQRIEKELWEAYSAKLSIVLDISSLIFLLVSFRIEPDS